MINVILDFARDEKSSVAPSNAASGSSSKFTMSTSSKGEVPFPTQVEVKKKPGAFGI